MCGRIKLTVTAEEIQASFGFIVPAGYRPRFNIAPSQDVLALAGAEDGVGLRSFRWGLVPFWARDPSIGSRMINARSETVAEKPAFRAAFSRRRCLVVADGFYEWKRDGTSKRPHLIRLPSRSPFTLAGLWEQWQRGQQVVRSCTILTTAPNRLVATIHDRMPVILSGEERELWLSPGAGIGDLKALLRPCPEESLELFEVSTRVNSPANDSPECAEPLSSAGSYE